MHFYSRFIEGLQRVLAFTDGLQKAREFLEGL